MQGFDREEIYAIAFCFSVSAITIIWVLLSIRQ